MGVALTDLGKVDRAREVTLQALAAQKQLVREHPEQATVRNALAMCYNNLSRVYRKAGQQEEELTALKNSLQMFDGLILEKPLDHAYRYDFGKVSANVGDVLLTRNRVDEAVTVCLKAVEILEPLEKSHPQELSYTLELARNCRLLGGAQALDQTPTPNGTDWTGRAIAFLDGMTVQTLGSPSANATG